MSPALQSAALQTATVARSRSGDNPSVSTRPCCNWAAYAQQPARSIQLALFVRRGIFSHPLLPRSSRPPRLPTFTVLALQSLTAYSRLPPL
ncbi:hypothetical protein P171DRAFT_437774 [Karstenula rhodostoma CBS 690.94]|uniref:Uncharacterized protein n=1 Tax=Karstenula rhodostoma CBS 690.94 TaxID=1392251 RepID=A0A9P4P4T7_9PLEO|nr:hypothetical protein P171DRAFT_437774 [Karstenula rhodostoma CBS 690.94]